MTTVTSARVAPSRVLLVASFGAFLAFLDATIVNVAFPSIRESVPDTTIGELSWVLNAYNIVFAAFLIVFGRLPDLVWRRRSLVWGVVVFTVASLALLLVSLHAIARGSGIHDVGMVVVAVLMMLSALLERRPTSGPQSRVWSPPMRPRQARITEIIIAAFLEAL